MKKGKKHRLLIYDRLHRQGRRLVFLLAIGMLVLYSLPFVVDAETQKLLWAPENDNLILFASLAFFFVFMVKLIAPRLPYVQCTERNVRIRLPFYVFVMSYRRITTTRPNQWSHVFPQKKLTRPYGLQHFELKFSIG